MLLFINHKTQYKIIFYYNHDYAELEFNTSPVREKNKNDWLGG